MSSVVQNMLDRVLEDGARSAKFECEISFSHPSLSNIDTRDIVYLVKTSQFPGKSHETVDLPFKGRNIPIKGQVKYDQTWVCTFYLTQDHKLKSAIENWIESLDQMHHMSDKLDNSVITAITSNNPYTQTLFVKQMDFSGSQDTATYRLYNAFPKSVQQIDVDYSNVGSILEFTVEFSYSHFDVISDKVNKGTYADELKKTALKETKTFVNDVKQNLADAVSKAKKDVSMSKAGKMLSNFKW